MTPLLDPSRAARVRAYVEANLEPLSDQQKAEVDRAMMNGEALPGTEHHREGIVRRRAERLG